MDKTGNIPNSCKINFLPRSCPLIYSMLSWWMVNDVVEPVIQLWWNQ